MDKLLERVFGLVTGLTWVSSTQSYKLNGPEGSYSSASIEIGRAKIVAIGEKDDAQTELNEEVEGACKQRMPQVMDALIEMLEENEA